MHKSIKVLLTLVVALFTLPVFGSSVSAEEGESIFKDGTYDIDYSVHYDGDMDVEPYFEKPATLTVEDGKQYIQLQHNASNFILSLTVPGSEVEVISEDEENNTRVVEFGVDGDLSNPVIIELNMFYGSTHEVEAVFDVSEVPLKGEDSDGVVTEEIPYLLVHESKEEVSSADQFFVKPATLTKEDGKQFIEMKLADRGMVTAISVPSGEVEIVRENGEGMIEFELEGDLSDVMLMDMTVDTPMGSMDHTVRTYFGVSDIEEVFPETDEEEGEETTPPGDDKDKDDSNDKDKKDNTNKDETKNEVNEEAKVDPYAADKVYTINYVVKHATEDKESAANQFFVKPATLLVKNGVNYIQITVTNSDMIDSLRTAHGDVVIVQKNSDGSMVIQFKVNDLSQPLVMDMHITVPGMYSMDHTARLIFDESSKTEVANADQYQIASGDNANGLTTNPQTGDTTNIMFYVLLLVGAGIPLAYIGYRRFVL